MMKQPRFEVCPDKSGGYRWLDMLGECWVERLVYGGFWLAVRAANKAADWGGEGAAFAVIVLMTPVAGAWSLAGLFLFGVVATATVLLSPAILIAAILRRARL